MEQFESGISPASSLETLARLRSALGSVMHIESHTIHDRPVELIEFSGRLTCPSDEAFDHIYDRFVEAGYTPMLTRRDDSRHLVIAQHGIVVPTPNNPRLNVILLIATILSTWLVGVTIAGGDQLARLVQPNADILSIYGTILSHPEIWLTALPYVLTLLGILGVHEMGHYVAARIHKAAVTLPFFIPLPIGLGTMGAVIRLKSPIKNRRQLFDIGVAGPLAGLVIAIPLLIIGLATSQVLYIGQPVPGTQEGNSLMYLFLKLITHGRILPSGGYDVILNAIAFPAWFGLVVTMINLLPIGQLDGGHVLYSLFGREQWRIAMITIFGLIGLGMYLVVTTGDILNVWFVWIFLAQIFGLRHPPPLDDITPLDRRRKLIGYATIVIFILIFTPIPFS